MFFSKGGDDARLRLVEEKVDFILKHLGISVPETSLDTTVRGFLVEGKKINAIKAYREATGAGLKEAKDAVERIEAQLGLRHR